MVAVPEGTLPRMAPSGQRLARLGLIAKGALYALLAVLAVRVTVGAPADADSQGALRAIAGEPFGSFILASLALGFAVYAGWQAHAAVTADNWRRRFSAAGRGVVWSGLTVSACRFLAGAGSRPKQEQSVTAAVLDMPFGTWAVAAAGAATIIVGLAFLRHLKDHRFMDNLRPLPQRRRALVKAITITGITAKAGVYALVGAFLIRAAIRHRANSGIGLDGALSQVARQPFGTYLLAAVATGLAAYAVWCWVRAVYEEVKDSNG